MAAGIEVATTHGPCAEEAVNHTPFSTPYHWYCDTMMIGIGELKTYMREVSGIGPRSGAPLITGVNLALVRSTVAVCGISLAMTVSCACAVAGIEAFTFSFGLSSGILKKSDGKLLPGTYCHGPAESGARNQRPVTRTYVFLSFKSLNTLDRKSTH